MTAALLPLVHWLHSTSVAAAVGGSSLLSGLLSATHLLGLTLVAGGALVSTLRLLGIIFPDRPVTDITNATDRGMLVGLTISVVTGVLMFAPRGPQIIENSFFQTKMLVLAAAAVFHVAFRRRVTRRPDAGPALLRFAGACGFALWFGVALAACAFILFE